MDRITNKKVRELFAETAKALGKSTVTCQQTEQGLTWNVGAIYLDDYAPADNPYRYQVSEITGPGGQDKSWTSYRMTGREFYIYLNAILGSVK